MTLTRGKRISVFLMIFWVLTSCGSSFDGSVTVYPTRKTDTGKRFPLNRTTYKASFETQTVVYWMPGLYEVPQRLVNCIVRDKYNWVGEYIDHSGKVQMVDGKIVNDTPDTIYVSSFSWWYLVIKGKTMTFSR
jgi:hypothetical protein